MGAIVAAGALYGCVLGSFGWTEAQPTAQPLAAAVQVPCLVLGSALLALPSYVVISILLGLRDDLATAMARLAGGLATFAIVLAALAPYTLVMYLSIERYSLAIVVNGLPFLVATLAARRTLQLSLRDLIAANPRHQISIGCFVVAFVFIAVQMAWSLRPFIGSPDAPFQLFREQAFTNAYDALADTLWRAAQGLD